MHTKWNMTVFLFIGLISAGILLYTAIDMLISQHRQERFKYAITMTISGFTAILVIALGLNNPANLINILARPETGLSSAVLSQIIVAIFGIVLFFRKVQGRFIPIFSACLFVLSVFCMFKLYMISTRPALNTFLLFLLLLVVAAQPVASLIVTKMIGGIDNVKRNSAIMLGSIGICTVVFLAFLIRLNGLTPSDRILTFYQVVGGSLASVFWAMIVFIIIIPTGLFSYSFVKQKFVLVVVCRVSATVGIFLLCILINQMQAASIAVEGRILF